MSVKTISILLPTRGRTTVLKKSLESLISTAKNPENLEILFGLDQDDQEVLDFVKDVIGPYLIENNIEARANVFKPLGFENMHTYVNTLAGTATGDWLFIWNDDGIMTTQNWDEEIEKHTGQFKLLAPKDNHEGHPYAIFPIIPRDWHILIGHISQNPQNDAWLSHIAYMLDIFERIDVEFIHDRADMTSNNNDATYQNRKYMEGNPSDPKDFGHEAQQAARVTTAHKLAWFLDRIGSRSTWWENVKTGNQEPFEKMVWAEGVKGAGHPTANKVESEELPDDTILTL
jgi:hypothetical protein